MLPSPSRIPFLASLRFGFAFFAFGSVLALHAQQPAPAEPAKEERKLLLQSVGLMGGAQVYSAYLNVGFLADNVSAGILEKQPAREVLQSVVELLKATDAHLERIGKIELSKADRDAVQELRRLGSLVRKQGEELDAYWMSNATERLQAYDQARQQAWQGLSVLLKLEKK